MPLKFFVFTYSVKTSARRVFWVATFFAVPLPLSTLQAVFDNGTSGVSTRLVDRPEGRRLFDKLRAGDVLVVRWVDRLGRNYDDVVETIREFMRRGVVIKTVINGMTFNGATKDPVQKAVRDALIAFTTAQARPKRQRPHSAPVSSTPCDPASANTSAASLASPRQQFRTVRDMLSQATGIAQIAKAAGLSRQTVYRIKDDPAACEAALTAWGI